MVVKIEKGGEKAAGRKQKRGIQAEEQRFLKHGKQFHRRRIIRSIRTEERFEMECNCIVLY